MVFADAAAIQAAALLQVILRCITRSFSNACVRGGDVVVNRVCEGGVWVRDVHACKYLHRPGGHLKVDPFNISASCHVVRIPLVRQDRLVTACTNGDTDAVAAALADGAIVNDAGSRLSGDSVTPLAAAIENARGTIVETLLAHGADPNGDNAMYKAVTVGSADILRQVGTHR